MRAKHHNMIVEDKSKEIGAKIIYKPSVDSTNNYAANLGSQGKSEHGTVIMSEEQTNGRGQRGNKWQSPARENLYSSFILEPNSLSVSEQSCLTEMISLALVDTLAKYGVNGTIKWPNDILVNDKKIAGVLIENSNQGMEINKTIIGVGLNVAQNEGLPPKATSILLESGQKLDPIEVLNELIRQVAPYWEAVKGRHFKGLKSKYLLNLYGHKKSRFYKINEELKEGEIQGVDEYGRLQVCIDGTVQTFDLKEIQFVY